MKKLTRLQEQSLPMSIAVFEGNKKQIAEIFERLNQAKGRLLVRIQEIPVFSILIVFLQVSTNLKIYKLVTDVKNDLSVCRFILLDSISCSPLAEIFLERTQSIFHS